MKAVIRSTAFVHSIVIAVSLFAIGAAAAQSQKSIELNEIAFTFAMELIKEGQAVPDRKGGWTKHRPSADEENEYIRLHGFAQYAKWHLGIDRRCTRLRGRLRSEYRFCVTTRQVRRSLRARALIGAADHARMRQTLPKPEANQVRNRSTYRENAAQCRELPRSVCKARWDNYRCSRTISLQSQDTRGTDESMQIEFAHCALQSPRCRSRDGHQNPKWQSAQRHFSTRRAPRRQRY